MRMRKKPDWENLYRRFRESDAYKLLPEPEKFKFCSGVCDGVLYPLTYKAYNGYYHIRVDANEFRRRKPHSIRVEGRFMPDGSPVSPFGWDINPPECHILGEGDTVVEAYIDALAKA